jgi:hypothetical protein
VLIEALDVDVCTERSIGGADITGARMGFGMDRTLVIYLIDLSTNSVLSMYCLCTGMICSNRYMW